MADFLEAESEGTIKDAAAITETLPTLNSFHKWYYKTSLLYQPCSKLAITFRARNLSQSFSCLECCCVSLLPGSVHRDICVQLWRISPQQLRLYWYQHISHTDGQYTAGLPKMGALCPELGHWCRTSSGHENLQMHGAHMAGILNRGWNKQQKDSESKPEPPNECYLHSI